MDANSGSNGLLEVLGKILGDVLTEMLDGEVKSHLGFAELLLEDLPSGWGDLVDLDCALCFDGTWVLVKIQTNHVLTPIWMGCFEACGEFSRIAFLGWVEESHESLELEEGWTHDSTVTGGDLVGGILGGTLELLGNWWEVEGLLMGGEFSELLMELVDVDIKSDMTGSEVFAWLNMLVDWTFIKILFGWSS